MSDVKLAVRQLAKKPGFTVTAVLMLALGIGACTAVYSVINAVLLQGLPFPESDRIVSFQETQTNFGSMSVSYPNFTDYARDNTVFEHLGVYRSNNFILTGRGAAVQLLGDRTSYGVHPALGAIPQLGRGFEPADDRVTSAPTVILSDGLWRSQFEADVDIIGKLIILSDVSHTVIGVMPASFAYRTDARLWVALGPTTAEEAFHDRDNHLGLWGIALLKRGVSLEQASEEIAVISNRLEQDYPDSNTGVGVRLRSLDETLLGPFRANLGLLFGAVTLMLLIGCANFANLLLVRGIARTRECAIRLAMGAQRSQLIRQMLTESLLLSVLGGAVGIVLASWGRDAIIALGPESFEQFHTADINLGVLALPSAYRC